MRRRPRIGRPEPAAASRPVDFFRADSGQGLVEYALIVALVAIVAVVSIRFFGSKVANSLNNNASQLP